MRTSDAIHLVRDTCKCQRLSLSTEKAYAHWITQYSQFLKAQGQFKDAPPNRKMEVFLSLLARKGVSASTQNQAFNALLFLYRECLKVELGPVNALRAR